MILMQANDIREMDTTKINQEIIDLKKELFTLRFEQATGQLENTARIGKVKKTIARMKTILNERA